MKIRSPQMMGVAALQEGKGVFQTMFSAALHVTGRFFASLIPSCWGPRQWGQLSPAREIDKKANTEANRMASFFILFLHVYVKTNFSRFG